jgi:hypothetical protein
MSKTSKILATIGVIFLFMILSGALQAGSGPGGRNTGIFGLILLFGVIAGVRAIWKSSDDDNNADNTSLKKD